MRKSLKRAFSVLLSVIMLFSLIPMTHSFAAEIIADNFQCGDNAYARIDDEGTLTIYGEGEIWKSAFSKIQFIRDVIIEDGITGIGDSAFWGCNSLTTVKFPDSLISVGNEVFVECYSLVNVNIPDSVISIGEIAFFGCGNLENIDVGENNQNYSSEDGVLFNKGKTELIQYPAGNERAEYTIPDSVTNLRNFAFIFCSNLTSLTIPAGVTSIGDEDAHSASFGEGYFSSCVGLKSINVSEGNQNYSSEDGVLFNKDKTELIQYPAGNERTKYKLPDSVEKIDEDAFRYANFLIDIFVNSDDIDLSRSDIGYKYKATKEVLKELFSRIVEYNKKIEELDQSLSPEESSKEKQKLKDEFDEWFDEHFGGDEVNPEFIIHCNRESKAESYGTSRSIAVAYIGDPHDHVYTCVITPAACTENGAETYTCRYCDDSYTVDIEASGHSYGEWERVTEPTCTEAGLKKKTCSKCNDVVTEEIEATGDHTVVVDEAVAPSCTKTGLTEGSHCSVCGKVFAAQDVVPTIDHSYGEWETVTDPTCGKAGLKKKTCTNCDDAVTEEIEATGKHTVVVDEAVAPSCTKTGLTEGSHCSACGKVLVVQNVVPKTAHSYGEWETVKESTCTEKGKKQAVCSECGETKTKNIPTIGHIDADGNEECDNCGASVKKSCWKRFWSALLAFLMRIFKFLSNLFAG